MINRRRLLAGASLAAMGTLAAPSILRAQGGQTVKMGALRLVHSMPPHFYEKFAPAGLKIEIITFDGQDAVTNAVVLGQADAMSADSPVTAWAIKQSNGKLESAGEVFDSAPYGWPVKKGSPLAQSLQKALEHLIASGDYKNIVAKWGLEAGAIDKPAINGAIS